MTWSYVFADAASGKQRGKLFVPLVLTLGILPDIDLLLEGYGIEHHTVTHSYFFWLILFIPFFAVFRLKALPYLVAVVQHFAFGDFLIGQVQLFWPFNTTYLGFNWNMGSTIDIVLEASGLFIALTLSYFNGDMKRLTRLNTKNIWMGIPALAVLSSIEGIMYDRTLTWITAFFISNEIIMILQIVLIAILVFSTFQGLRGLFQKPKNRLSVERSRIK